MALDAPVPNDVRKYKERILANMSLRQIICGGISLVLAVGISFLTVFVFHIDTTIQIGLVLIAVVPILAIGFIRPKGFTCEAYFMIILRHHRKVKRRPYISTRCNGGNEVRKREKKRTVRECRYERIAGFGPWRRIVPVGQSGTSEEKRTAKAAEGQDHGGDPPL